MKPLNNNQAINNIMTRVSIRKYTEEKISKEDLNTILKAAMAAPTAHNRRPYHFIVIEDQNVKDQLSQVNPHSKMIKESALTIAVCGDIELEPTMDFIHHDCAAAIQNILLASHAINLGAVWVGIKQDLDTQWINHVTKVLDLPDHIKPIGLVPIGHVNQDRVAKERFDENLIHYNKWL